jgi:hypothetical protein
MACWKDIREGRPSCPVGSFHGAAVGEAKAWGLQKAVARHAPRFVDKLGNGR